jgi:chemotaxis methyl-accepting protein methylase
MMHYETTNNRDANARRARIVARRIARQIREEQRELRELLSNPREQPEECWEMLSDLLDKQND